MEFAGHFCLSCNPVGLNHRDEQDLLASGGMVLKYRLIDAAASSSNGGSSSNLSAVSRRAAATTLWVSGYRL